MAADTLCTAYREKAIYLRHIPLSNCLPTSLYLLSNGLTKTVCLLISLPSYIPLFSNSLTQRASLLILGHLMGVPMSHVKFKDRLLWFEADFVKRLYFWH